MSPVINNRLYTGGEEQTQPDVGVFIICSSLIESDVTFVLHLWLQRRCVYRSFFSVIFLEHTVTVHNGLHGKSTNKQNAAITDANAVLKYKKPQRVFVVKTTEWNISLTSWHYQSLCVADLEFIFWSYKEERKQKGKAWILKDFYYRDRIPPPPQKRRDSKYKKTIKNIKGSKISKIFFCLLHKVPLHDTFVSVQN